ncbi:hypothetical protein HY251_14725 [bacterium]|nr:hypothetical protein [bacterium]
MHSLRRLALGTIAGAALLSLAGCLEYDEVLTLAKDGSGQLTLDLTVDMTFYFEKVRPLLPVIQSEDSEETKPFTKEEIQKDCEAKGVKVKTCEVSDLGKNRTRLKLALDFKDLESLRSIRRFSDRELEFEENGDDLEVSYKVDPRSALAAKGFDMSADVAKTPDEKKIAEAIEEARNASRARFALKLPGKVTKTNATSQPDGSVRRVVDRTDKKALAALAKEPLSITASFPKKDAAFMEKEKERKKLAQEKAEADKQKPEKTDGE